MNIKYVFTGFLALAFGLVPSVLANPTDKLSRAGSSIKKSHPKTVRVKVSEAGFSPSSIDAESGHRLNIVFNRTDNAICKVVIFPKLKIRKGLPVGRDVIVSFTPREPGQVSFTCGTQYKGNIVISEG